MEPRVTTDLRYKIISQSLHFQRKKADSLAYWNAFPHDVVSFGSLFTVQKSIWRGLRLPLRGTCFKTHQKMVVPYFRSYSKRRILSPLCHFWRPSNFSGANYFAPLFLVTLCSCIGCIWYKPALHLKTINVSPGSHLGNNWYSKYQYFTNREVSSQQSKPKMYQKAPNTTVSH